jgi:DNA-binding MarR family transcriptional regulator
MSLVRRLRREAEHQDISFSQISLLGAIERLGGEATPSALASAEGLRSSNFAALLRCLESDKLVIRKPDVTDKRKARVSLTPLGITTLEHHRYRREQWLASAIQQCLSAQERTVLFEAGKLIERLAHSTEHDLIEKGNS